MAEGAKLVERLRALGEAIDGNAVRAWPEVDAALVREAADELEQLQRGVSRFSPMQRSSPETVSCVFCGADKIHSYVTGDRTPHAETCAWRVACEARGIPWNNVL